MKTYKIFGIACMLVMASGKIFAQNTDNQTPKTDAQQQIQPVANDDKVGTFLKNYQAYLENQNVKEKKPLVQKSAASEEAVTKAVVNLQASSNVLGAVAPTQNSNPPVPAINIFPGFNTIKAENVSLNSSYLEVKLNHQMAATAPVFYRPAEPTLSEKVAMVKKALAAKEELDKQGNEPAEKPTN